MNGLAEMALKLATQRTYDTLRGWSGWVVLPRAKAFEHPCASAEYYRIIDRITRGEAP